jgi:hypothetical protein
MNRREALTLTSLVVGGTIIGSEMWLSGCSPAKKKPVLLSDDDILLLDEVGEIILPKTDRSPGAKDARIGEFMKTIVTDCYDEPEQMMFMDGIEKIDGMSKKKFSKPFLKLSADEKSQLIVELDTEAKQYKKENKSNPHYFTLMKQLTIWGYFSSEQGATQALKYNPVPGRYEGCVPYNNRDKAWA